MRGQFPRGSLDSGEGKEGDKGHEYEPWKSMLSGQHYELGEGNFLEKQSTTIQSSGKQSTG